VELTKSVDHFSVDNGLPNRSVSTTPGFVSDQTQWPHLSILSQWVDFGIPCRLWNTLSIASARLCPTTLSDFVRLVSDFVSPVSDFVRPLSDLVRLVSDLVRLCPTCVRLRPTLSDAVRAVLPVLSISPKSVYYYVPVSMNKIGHALKILSWAWSKESERTESHKYLEKLLWKSQIPKKRHSAGCPSFARLGIYPPGKKTSDEQFLILPFDASKDRRFNGKKTTTEKK
jgi:hypothetical protein